MNHLNKRLLALLLLFAMVFSLAACGGNADDSDAANSPEAKKEQEAFDAFLQEEMVAAVEADYMTAHIFFVHPEEYGIDMNNVEVNCGPRFDEASLIEGEGQAEEDYKKLTAFDRSLLTAEQQDLYDTLVWQQELAVKLDDPKFRYYSQLFSPMGGIQSSLPSIFADWELRSEQDAKDLILLMEDIRPYVASALDYTRMQQEKQLLMVDLNGILEFCQVTVDKGEDSSILAALNEQIDGLQLDATKTADYKAQLKDAFVSSYLGAYADIIAAFTDMQSGYNNPGGLAAFPDGAEYFELLLQQKIGSTKSSKEVEKMMDTAYQTHLGNIQTIATEHYKDLAPLLAGEDIQTGLTSYDEILTFISDQMDADFPTVGNLDYNIRQMNEEVASDAGIAAYFNVPPIDGDGTKQMRVNPSLSDYGALDTYKTVAHEGFPGHMYQFAYLYDNVSNLYKKILTDNGSYVEGYAVYAGYTAFTYLDLNQNLLDAYRENEVAIYNMLIMADIGIHRDGWDLDAFGEFLSDYGYDLEGPDLQDSYDQLRCDPAAFEAYYVGYEEILSLRTAAETSLGNKFSALDFNEALLQVGPMSWNAVERSIRQYVEDNGGTYKKSK